MNIKVNKSTKLAVIGLGYVGFPLAMSFSKKYSVLGFDISQERIKELKDGFDRTLEVNKEDILQSNIQFSSTTSDLADRDFYIVTVPTPVDGRNRPDLSMLRSACELMGSYISKGAVIIFESTVYPGCTEDFCIPIIETYSGLHFNKDFFVGYSPERINPGDKDNSFEKINKVVSGSNDECLKAVKKLYSSVIKAMVFSAKSIKVAEASKVIENTQRDINIALMNELSEIFNKLGIKTNDVLDAASTKWNFNRFYPGLVGGHCIGVDPYYLSYKSKILGIQPRMILSGRSINNKVPSRIVNLIYNKLDKSIPNPKLLILGFTFKENCPDIRNSGALKVISKLNRYEISPTIYDPYFKNDPNLSGMKYNFLASLKNHNAKYDALLLLVPHERILKLGVTRISNFRKKSGLFFDLKNSLNLQDSYSL